MATPKKKEIPQIVTRATVSTMDIKRRLRNSVSSTGEAPSPDKFEVSSRRKDMEKNSKLKGKSGFRQVGRPRKEQVSIGHSVGKREDASGFSKLSTKMKSVAPSIPVVSPKTLAAVISSVKSPRPKTPKTSVVIAFRSLKKSLLPVIENASRTMEVEDTEPTLTQEVKVEETSPVNTTPMKSEVVTDVPVTAGPSSKSRGKRTPPEIKPDVAEVNIENIKVEIDEDVGDGSQPELLPLSSAHGSCLLCNKRSTTASERNKKKSEEASPLSPVESSLQVMFILKNMLSIPDDQIKIFLGTQKNPHEWIGLCQSCQPLVREALEVNEQVKGLFQKLRCCRDKIVNKIKTTQTEYLSPRSRARPRPVSEEQNVTTETRRIVSQQDYSKLNPFILDAHHGADPRLSSQSNNSAENISTVTTVVASSSANQINQTKPIKLREAQAVPDVSTSKPASSTSQLNSDPEVSSSSTPTTDLINSNNDQQTDQSSEQGTKMEVDEDTIELENLEDEFPAVYTCPKCPRVEAMNLATFVTHIAFHFDNPFKCSYCQTYLPNLLKGRINHWRTFHQGLPYTEMISEEKLDEDKVPIYACSDCFTSFTTDVARNMHERSAHQIHEEFELEFRCITCNSRFALQSEWKLHRALAHPQVAKVSCPECDETFGLVENNPNRFNGGQVVERDEERLRQHMSWAHAPASMHCLNLRPCKLCGEIGTWTSLEEMGAHLQSKHPTVYSVALAAFSSSVN